MLNELIVSLVLPVPEPEVSRSELEWGRVTDRFFRDRARVLAAWVAVAPKEWRGALVDLHENPLSDEEWEALVAAHDLGANFQSFEVAELVYEALAEWGKVDPDAAAVQKKTTWWTFKRE